MSESYNKDISISFGKQPITNRFKKIKNLKIKNLI